MAGGLIRGFGLVLMAGTDRQNPAPRMDRLGSNESQPALDRLRTSFRVGADSSSLVAMGGLGGSGERRAAMLREDLSRDMPSSLARFGTDTQCREYLFSGRWPDGFRCAACGHDRAWAKARLIHECAACGKRHSLLAGTIFEQTKTGLAKWFLAIFPVTSSKGGISAMELNRQMGFGSYQTAGTLLHRIQKVMDRPDRERLIERVEADETYLGGPRRVKPGRGPAVKTKVAGAVESGRGKAKGRRLGRLKLAMVPDVSAPEPRRLSRGLRGRAGHCRD
jgi:hypothetical protein